VLYYTQKEERRTITMKYIITIALLVLILFTACAPKPTSTIYPKSGYVIEVDRENDTVTFVDSMGEAWTFSGVEDWAKGDGIAAIMDTMGTESIYDDEIIEVRYERW
jgi:hypothetical protein